MLYQKSRFNNQMYKTCKQCGRQMPRHAKVCPNCCKKQTNVFGIIMKIFGVYCLIMLMIIAIDSYDDYKETSTKENSSHSEEKEREQKESTFEYADVKIKYLKSEIAYNSIDEKCLYVYFEMTNNSDENYAFNYLVSCQAFQNGIELDANYIYDCEEEKNGSKEIQPEATIKVAEVFELSDSTENVTLEVRPLNIWSDKLLFEREIQITE